MNNRSKRLILDMVLAVSLSLALSFFSQTVLNELIIYHFALEIIPIIWLALRYGMASGILTGALSGLLIGLLGQGLQAWADIILANVLALGIVGFSGLFAKYTQKTLNNHRYSSTYLNIGTGSLLGSLLYYLVRFGLAPFVNGYESSLALNSGNFWISLILTAIIAMLVLIALARLNPAIIIPKRTRFLSRKETSSLLND